MNKKKIFAVVVVILLILIVALVIRKMTESDEVNADKGFVFDKNSPIKLKDIEIFYKDINFKEESAKDYFKDSIVNPYTIKFFMFLDENFKEFDSEEELLENVRKYLYDTMPEAMAGKLFELYKKFVRYQLTLGEKANEWGMPKTTEETVSFLHKLQNYRREVFGREIADVLFGASIKAEEYPLRRGAILNSRDMYGAEKEKRLQQLNQDMWGDEAQNVDAYAEPYVRYREKLAMYEKDFSEMSEEARKSQIKIFREELFSPEQVRGFEEVDRAIAKNEKMDQDYKAREAEIIHDASLEKAEKEKIISELQNQMYGDEADALRRRLAIEKGAGSAVNK